MQAGERVGGRFLLKERLVPENDARHRRVWHAEDREMGRDVVLKDVGGAERAPGYAPGEVRAIAQIVHPHVITVYQFLPVEGEGDHDGDWAVLEWAPGGSLANETMAPARAAAIAAQLASALVHLHGLGIVHGDVKPGNIVRTGGGAAKLTDFGSAYRISGDDTVTPPSPISYTPGYAAPEIVERHRPVPKSDVYSLAATAYALVKGAPPERQPTDLGRLGPLGSALESMLADDPADRPDAADAQRLLQAAADGVAPESDGTTTDSITPLARPDVVPAQLPADVAGFAGRAAELDALGDLLTPGTGDRPAAVVISAVSGTAGVGKTALAVHWAHCIADRYPDGQLYVNLRGFDPTGQVMAAADAVRGFLDALGVAADRVPAGTEAQIGLYRSLLARRRVLVLLDNARDTGQVLPLLPGAPGCLALVTSRNHLVDLIGQHGAHPLDLPVLDRPDAWQLLEQRLGTDRTAAEPDAVAAIITACAGLPLALAIVAARAAIRPRFPLATFATELRDSHARLGALTGEGPGTNIRAVFSWSYTQLTPAAQRLFRLLGRHPGPDISVPAAASLAGLPPAHVPPLLADLTRAHLIDEHAPGRYTFHDLLRAYASELARTTDPDDDRHAAAERMLDHYLYTAYAADGLLYPWRKLPPITAPRAAGVTPEQFVDQQQARTWFTAEHTVLLAIFQHAGSAEVATRTWQLASAFDYFLGGSGRLDEVISVWQTIVGDAQAHDEHAGQASAHYFIALACIGLGRLDDAEPHLQRSIELSGVLGDHHRQGRNEFALARICEQQGRYADALDHSRRALDLFRNAGSRIGEARMLNGIGWYLAHLGKLDTALTHCERAVELARQIDDAAAEAEAWNSIGYIHDHLHHVEDAVTSYRRALDIYDDLGSRLDGAITLGQLGDTQYAAGDLDAARGTWRRALTIFDEAGHPDADAVRAKLERLDQPPGNGTDQP